MSLLQRELDKIREALLTEKNQSTYDRLYATQQALVWALEPTGFRSPFNSIMGIPADSEDCLAHRHPLRSLDTCSQSGSSQPRPTLSHQAVG